MNHRFQPSQGVFRAPKAVQLEQLISTANASIREVIRSELPSSRVVPNSVSHLSLSASSKDQNYHHSWQFSVFSKCPLRSVFLLESPDPCASFSLRNISVRRQFSSAGKDPRHPGWEVDAKKGDFRRLIGVMSKGNLQFDITPADPTFQLFLPSQQLDIHYTLNVELDSPVMGDYEQMLVFDFGRFPTCLGVPISVSCGNGEDNESDEEDMKNKFWPEEDSEEDEACVAEKTKEVVQFKFSDPKDEHQLTEFEETLLKSLGSPQEPALFLEDGAGEAESLFTESLSKANYRRRMLALLNQEQETREELLNQKSVNSQLDLSFSFVLNSDEETSGEIRCAKPDEAFARVTLNGVLSEDHPAGRLLCQQAEMALVEPLGGAQVFQCPIDYKARDHIFLRLHADCVSSLGFSTRRGDEAESASKVTMDASYADKTKRVVSNPDDVVIIGRVQAKVRFVLSPLMFAEIRYALQQLKNLDNVFPDLGEEFPPLELPKASEGGRKKKGDPKRKGLKELGMNQKQNSVLEAVSAKGAPGDPNPPIIVVGPFGTGKTFTLAKASKHILSVEPESRLLICTLSNSAADLYISQYFGKWHNESRVEKKVPVGYAPTESRFPKPLRIYYTGRWVSSIPEDVIEFCCTESVKGSMNLRWPKKEELRSSRVVISTLSTAKILLELLEPGWFTHIFIDEAGQASEPQTLIPLCLAAPETKLILAGDPLQSGAECYSKIARKCGFNMSLLERLWNLYPDDNPRKIQLTINFRAHEVLTEFMGENFYRNHLHSAKGQREFGFVSCCELEQHPKYYPITFIATRGIERQDPYSTGYYNKAEVLTVAQIVEQIADNWPTKEWGTFTPSDIGVLSIYGDQIIRIRHALKKKKLGEVKVEKVQNVQGKEYKVVVVSTVRTLETCYPNAETIQTDMTDNFGCRTLDFGFLSEPRLLNTALTRAQTLLVVVGDPASLAAIGPCKEIWQNFINAASRNGSLEGTTWVKLKAHLKSIQEAVDAGYVGRSYLNARATEFRPLSPLLDRSKPPEEREEERKLLVQGMDHGLWPALIYTPHRGPVTVQLPAQLVYPFLPKEPAPYLPNGVPTTSPFPGLLYPGGAPLMHYQPYIPFGYPPPGFIPVDPTGFAHMGGQLMVPGPMINGDHGTYYTGTPLSSGRATAEPLFLPNGYPESVGSSCASPPIIVNGDKKSFDNPLN